jgi:hypothetical protein
MRRIIVRQMVVTIPGAKEEALFRVCLPLPQKKRRADCSVLLLLIPRERLLHFKVVITRGLFLEKNQGCLPSNNIQQY